MGIRALCAAAAVVAGVAQTEAATVDRVKLTLAAEYICEDEPCADPAPPIDFFGLRINQPIVGFLSIGDEGNEWLRSITFSMNGLIYDFGEFSKNGDSYLNEDLRESSTLFTITWNGFAGSLWYRDDHTPWSLDVRSTIELSSMPVPTPAVLLPIGLGAIALMRRRRPKAS